MAILDPAGNEVGRGLIAYDAPEAVRIAGRKTGEIAGILGYEARAAFIHRDDMVVTGATESDHADDA